MLVYGKYACFDMPMLYVCVLCASCDSSQCSVLHHLQFVDAGRGCKRRPYGRGILQGRSHDCLVRSHDYLLLFSPSNCSYILQGLGWTECKLLCLDCYVLSRQILYVGMVVCIYLLYSCLCVYMWWQCNLLMSWPEPVLWVVVSLKCKC